MVALVLQFTATGFIADRAAAQATLGPDPIVLKNVLLIPPCGKDGRTPLRTDPIEFAIVRATCNKPRAGDTVAATDGSIKAWTAATAADDGWLRDDALAGGYVLWSFDIEADRIMLLDAAGHSVAYVNGEPRAGDPYSAGFVHLPVALRAGDNSILFRVARGQLRASLSTPSNSVEFDASDLTLPDMVVGQGLSHPCGIVVRNATDQPLVGWSIIASASETEVGAVPIEPIPPLSNRKAVAFLVAAAPAKGATEKKVHLRLAAPDGRSVSEADLTLRVREPDQDRKVTIQSQIDGSAQYFAVLPAVPAHSDGDAAPGLILSLHGASVEATSQSGSYAAKDWCSIVAPTNRRPFGFDWEDWGRLDALEVLDHATTLLSPDPRRVYLTGHSMGGHGTWQLGVHFPDRFAAIAPSAGWISFWSYAGGAALNADNPVEAILKRAASPSDTLALSSNYLHEGIYVLHGDADDNVPVDQARQMRAHLATFHPDFAYREIPGAGHWWGNACVDWPPLMAYLKDHALPDPTTVNHVRFATSSPGVSPRCHWVTVVAQEHWLSTSTVDLTRDLKAGRITGTTSNVARLALDLGAFASDQQLSVELDGGPALPAPNPPDRTLLFDRSSGDWTITPSFPPTDKNPARCGPFKSAFVNNCILVYGTTGTPEENRWSLNKARFDAETFWVRGNGSFSVLPDSEVLSQIAGAPDSSPFARNLVLYGNAETNSAWKSLLQSDSAIRVSRAGIRLGERTIAGDDLAVICVRPGDHAGLARNVLIGLVGGTGLAGMRLTDRMPFFLSGVGYPDCMIMSPDILEKGSAGIRAAGFFGTDWSVASGDFAWSDDPAAPLPIPTP